MARRRLLLAWLSVAGASVMPVACGSAASRHARAVEQAEPRAAAAPACVSIDLPDEFLEGQEVLLVGDFHGTAEIPAFFAELACAALGGTRDLIVALELPAEEQGRVDSYLDSAGSEADRRALLEGAFWNQEYQDGRRSRAMAAMIERLRTVRKAGLALEPPRRVAVLLMDVSTVSSPGARDRSMADAILRALRASASTVEPVLLMAYAGNLHTRTAKGSPWDPGFESMGYHLAQTLPAGALRAVDVAHAGGTAWFCTTADPAECGEKPLKGRAEGSEWAIRLFDRPNDEGYSGTFFVGRVTASPPARER